jgi:septum formation protein
MLNDKCSMSSLPKLILASGSPRRAEILSFVGWKFEKRVADIDETEFPGEKPEDYVKRLAREKAEAIAANYENALVLGADTIVVIDNQIIGKPKDLDDARRMLRILSGNWHEVFTGVALISKSEPSASADGLNANNSDVKGNQPAHAGGSDIVVDLQKTSVKFAELSDEEIEFLVEKGEPLDKAGAYAVQAQAALFIEKIEGDYWNVVGLPVNLVYRLMQEITSR